MTSKNSKSQVTQNKKLEGQQPTQSIKVLYQNLGGTWYAFADINDEIFFSPLSFKQSTSLQNEGNATENKTEVESDEAA